MKYGEPETPSMAEKKEEFCPARDDTIHCVHWWDGEKCCSCESNEGEISEPTEVVWQR